MSDIILISEKKKLPDTSYVVWPGDEAYEMANKTTSSKSKPPSYKVSKEPFATDHYKSGFKQRDYQAEKKLATTEDKRPNSMKNRYFSIENIEKVNEENAASTPQTSSSALESNEFMQRRDYLIKKTFKISHFARARQNGSNRI